MSFTINLKKAIPSSPDSYRDIVERCKRADIIEKGGHRYRVTLYKDGSKIDPNINREKWQKMAERVVNFLSQKNCLPKNPGDRVNSDYKSGKIEIIENGKVKDISLKGDDSEKMKELALFLKNSIEDYKDSPFLNRFSKKEKKWKRFVRSSKSQYSNTCMAVSAFYAAMLKKKNFLTKKDLEDGIENGKKLYDDSIIKTAETLNEKDEKTQDTIIKTTNLKYLTFEHFKGKKIEIDGNNYIFKKEKKVIDKPTKTPEFKKEMKDFIKKYKSNNFSGILLQTPNAYAVRFKKVGNFWEITFTDSHETKGAFSLQFSEKNSIDDFSSFLIDNSKITLGKDMFFSEIQEA